MQYATKSNFVHRLRRTRSEQKCPAATSDESRSTVTEGKCQALGLLSEGVSHAVPCRESGAIRGWRLGPPESLNRLNIIIFKHTIIFYSTHILSDAQMTTFVTHFIIMNTWRWVRKMKRVSKCGSILSERLNYCCWLNQSLIVSIVSLSLTENSVSSDQSEATLTSHSCEFRRKSFLSCVFKLWLSFIIYCFSFKNILLKC